MSYRLFTVIRYKNQDMCNYSTVWLYVFIYTRPKDSCPRFPSLFPLAVVQYINDNLFAF